MSVASRREPAPSFKRESRLEPTDVGCYNIEIKMKTKKTWREKLADNKGLSRVSKSLVG